MGELTKEELGQLAKISALVKAGVAVLLISFGYLDTVPGLVSVMIVGAAVLVSELAAVRKGNRWFRVTGSVLVAVCVGISLVISGLEQPLLLAIVVVTSGRTAGPASATTYVKPDELMGWVTLTTASFITVRTGSP